MALIGVLSIIELSTAMPKAGGDYYYINRTFGPVFGTVSGFLGWLALSLKSAFAIFGIAEIILKFTGVNPLISSFILCLVFVVINIAGVKGAAAFQTWMVAGLLTLMTLYVLAGIFKISPAAFADLTLEKMGLSEFWRITAAGVNKGDICIHNILVTAGFIFVSFGGLLKVANVSEEVIDPKKNLPKGMIYSVLIVTVLYTLIVLVITGTLEPETFKKSLTPVADSARLILGYPGYVAIIIASMLAFITTANAGIMSAARYPLALSRDKLLPPFFGKINKRFNTPVIATLITGLFIFLSLLLPIETLVKAASTVILTSYVLTNLSVIVLKESNLSNYKPSFKAPFYPWLQIISALLFSVFIYDMGSQAIDISLGFLGICFCLYFFYGRRYNTGEYALLHLLKHIADKRLAENILEDELREIVIHRDELEMDNFDDLIKKADFYDLEGPMEYENLVTRLSPAIAKSLDVSAEKVKDRFMRKQEEFNTAITNFLAIPHIIVNDNNEMFLSVVRCREGIKFTDSQKSIKAVFLFGGTMAKRNLHFKTLASIASLVETENFEKKWMQAENTTELKDFMLFSQRSRIH
jgi:amino acid transporter/mannitol/fructose-specific phosphotransferase system IIA component (Ntr-type)